MALPVLASVCCVACTALLLALLHYSTCTQRPGVALLTGGPDSDSGNGDGAGAAGGDRSMIDVLCAQRDRLRDRAARLEEGDLSLTS